MRKKLYSIILIIATFTSANRIYGMKQNLKFSNNILYEATLKKSAEKIEETKDFIGILDNRNSFELYDIKNPKKPILQEKMVYKFMFSPNKKMLLIFYHYNNLQIYDLKKSPIKEILSCDNIQHFEFSPKSNYIALQTRVFKQITWPRSLMLQFCVFDLHHPKEPIVLIPLIPDSKNGPFEYMFSEDEEIIIAGIPPFFEIHTLKKGVRSDLAFISHFAKRPDGIIFACDDKEYPIQFYETKTKSFVPIIWKPKHNLEKYKFIFSDNGSTVAIQCPKKIRIYAIRDLKLSLISETEISPNIKKLNKVSNNGQIVVFDLNKHTEHCYETIDIKKIYTTKSKQLIPTIDNVIKFAFSTDESILAVTTKNYDTHFQIYTNSEDGIKTVWENPLKNMGGFFFQSTSQKIFIWKTSGSNTLLIYDTTCTQPTVLLKLNHVRNITSNPSGNICTFESYQDKTFQLYNLETKKLIQTIPNVTSFAFIKKNFVRVAQKSGAVKTFSLPPSNRKSIPDKKERVRFIHKLIDDTQELMENKKQKLYKKINFRDNKKVYLPTAFFIAIETLHQKQNTQNNFNKRKESSKKSDILKNMILHKKNSKKGKKKKKHSK